MVLQPVGQSPGADDGDLPVRILQVAAGGLEPRPRAAKDILFDCIVLCSEIAESTHATVLSQ